MISPLLLLVLAGMDPAPAASPASLGAPGEARGVPASSRAAPRADVGAGKPPALPGDTILGRGALLEAWRAGLWKEEEEGRPRPRLSRGRRGLRLGLASLDLPLELDLPAPPALRYPLGGVGHPPHHGVGPLRAAMLPAVGLPRPLLERAGVTEDLWPWVPAPADTPAAPDSAAASDTAAAPDTTAAPDPAAEEAAGEAAVEPAGDPASADSAGAEGTQESPSILDSEFAQLDVQLRGRGEFGGDWTRFEPCQVGLQESCDPGLFPQLSPDIQFGVRMTGTISERIHVDVDYDETREFSATNNVNVYYQGLEGETVRRVEVGDVTMAFPESRFLTQGIPAGNFGIRALTDLGPVEVQTVWAQQNGDISSRSFDLTGVGGRQAFVQEDTLVLDDADYVEGQFFFLVQPEAVLDYPHVDVLALDPGKVPPSVAPGSEPIQLYRFENDPVTRQQVEGYIQADAVAEKDGQEVKESGWFRYLQPGVDYFLHPSGLWLALRRPLRREEMLAVTYVTAAGDTIGDYDPERIHNAGGRPTLRLLKAPGPRHQPGAPTWEMEMHQVYRISGSDDVEETSVALSISLGELSAGRTFKRRPTGEEITLLRLLGLDEESPTDQLDAAYVYRPAQDYFQGQSPVSGTFIVFPTLRPFLEPPPLPSLGLTAADTREIIGADANATIYETVDPVARENGGLYRLTIPFRIRSEGVVSAFSLGALGIRDGSERIYFGERLLIQGQDYLIDYDIGQVTLLDAEALFATNPQGRIRATWEQKALFRIAPTSIFGLNARYGLGERGDVHLLGLYQKEQTLQNRPQLGVEPASIFMGGVNGALAFGAGWLDRAAERLPGAGADSAASLSVQGEMAVSLPNPNTLRDVYVDDFDATDALPLSLRSPDWNLGSAPADREGAGDLLPGALDGQTTAELVWQHTWIQEGAGGDSVGIFEGYFPRRDIDEEIRIAGTETRETGLHLTFGDGNQGALEGRRWRSITTLLSATGTDLTRSDFLEFYVAGGDSLTLILDLGRVSEDAMFVAPGGATSGVRPETGEPWGLTFLDQEADTRRGEIWNDLLDERGVWVEECEGSRRGIYPLGDPRANCTRNNGRNDTEDLDGDGNLATGERIYRYVVSLDGSSPYLARTRDETDTSFRLFRIPLRGPGALNVGGRVTEADWRAVKHLRITVAGARAQELDLVRMRILGSRWVKRGAEGILRGIFGEMPGGGGRLDVGPVSALSEGGRYTSPPGVLEELDDPTQAFAGGGVEFGEKSLGIDVEGLGPGERAEVYYRFPQRPRNFLTYRQARIWVAATEGDWGTGGGRFFLKVGSDPDNFYLYQVPRSPAFGGEVGAVDWRPEVVVDFGPWLALRRRAEEELIRNPPAPGGPPLEVWSADSTYAVVLKDRARAPNLAAVRELSLGIWNPGAVPLEGVVWVNELRLSRAVEDAGYAGWVDVVLDAPRLLRTSLTYSGKGAFFRQLTDDPTYQDDGSLALNSTLELGRVAPAGWGIEAPLTVTHTRVSQQPTFLPRSDVRASRIDGLRETGASETRVEVGLRRTTPVGNPVLDPVLAGLSLRASYSRSRLSTTTLESDGSGYDARAEYLKEVEPREVPLVPGFAAGVVRALLPQGLEAALLDARLRWTPEEIRMGSLYYRRDRTSYRYEQILALPSDTLVTPTVAPREALETTARIRFRPLASVSAEASFFSVRDLLEPEVAARDPAVRPLLAAEGWELGPLGLGWETRRNLRTRLGFRPRPAPWLRTDFSVTTDYTSNRNAALVETLVVGSDTVLALQRNANGGRSTRASVSLDPARLALGGTGRDSVAGQGVLARLLGALDPLTLSRQGGLTARFFRQPVNPGTGFQLGLGDLRAFRLVDGDTASILTDRTTWTGGTGVRLPADVRVTGRYSDSRTRVRHVRSDRTIRTRTWPDLRVALNRSELPSFLGRAVRSLSLGTGFRTTLRESTVGGVGVQRRSREEQEVPLDVAVTWPAEVTTRYRGSWTDGEGEDPTGDTDIERRDHSFLLGATLQEPPLLAERLEGPLRLSLGYQYSSQSECRVPSGRTECVPFVDFLNRSVNLTLGTILSRMEVGLHLTYTDRTSFVGLREGSSQFQLGIFGQFLFDSGRFVQPSPGGWGPGGPGSAGYGPGGYGPGR